MSVKPPLQLEDYFYPEISVTGNPQYDGKSCQRVLASEYLDTRVSVLKIPGSDHRYQIQVQVSVKNDGNDNTALPYLVNLLSIGFVECTECNAGDDTDYTRVAYSAGSILYTSARELVLNITSRGPWGGRLLPTVSPSELISEFDILEVEAEKPLKQKSKITKKIRATKGK